MRKMMIALVIGITTMISYGSTVNAAEHSKPLVKNIEKNAAK